MADHAILVKSRVGAEDVKIWNRSAIAGSATDIDNGGVFRLDTKSTASGEAEVWAVTLPSTNGSTMNNLWMAYSPEVVVITSGNLKWKGLTPDPRLFYNSGSTVFDAFKPQVGDVIRISSDGISGSPSTGDYVQPANATSVLAWAASQTTNYLCWKILKETYISIGSGSIDTQRKLAYDLVCLAN